MNSIMVDPAAIVSTVLTFGPYVLATLAVIYFCFAYFYAWKHWNAYFGGKRVSRRVASSPSNAQPPLIVPYEESKARIVAAAETLNQEDDTVVKALEGRTARKSIKLAATIAARKKAARVQTMTARGVEQIQTELTNRGTRKTITSANGVNVGSLSAEPAEGLDMDHVYLTFTQILWGYTFVGLNAHFLMLRNTFLLRLRVWLNKIGIVKPRPVDYDAFAATMCLETSMACYYRCKVDDIAGFFFPHLP